MLLRLPEKIRVYPADVVLFEGILVFYTQEVRDMFHMKLFVDTDSDVRLSRRGNAKMIASSAAWGLKMLRFHVLVEVSVQLSSPAGVLRDMRRGRDLEQILSQYTTFVKPAFEEFCLPTKKYADVIIPRGVDNMVAINLIVQHIQDILSGDICKWQRSSVNGHTHGRSLKRGVVDFAETPGGSSSVTVKRPLMEPSTRPH
ncbi:hypothetical protein DNTS_004682 [Danionella cerebrum]|uniref:uridine/cytidine kinase n=1 Tax=Danionella cerebrum TaxID=2873325 RepID=A0A553QYM4_9TELE|nr:hypothetical protein DNTS_004682 [Danionella translucida]